ncbi:MAG: hypothetical protein ACRDYX_23650, partial [Egibacteraceae bacterium]
MWPAPEQGQAMLRRSPYRIELSDAGRQKLERRARSYTLPYRDVARAETALLAAAGTGNDEIAARLDTRREIVCKRRKRFFEQGLAGLDERPRAGRPGVFPRRPSSRSRRWPASRLPRWDAAATAGRARHPRRGDRRGLVPASA